MAPCFVSLLLGFYLFLHPSHFLNENVVLTRSRSFECKVTTVLFIFHEPEFPLFWEVWGLEIHIETKEPQKKKKTHFKPATTKVKLQTSMNQTCGFVIPCEKIKAVNTTYVRTQEHRHLLCSCSTPPIIHLSSSKAI